VCYLPYFVAIADKELQFWLYIQVVVEPPLVWRSERSCHVHKLYRIHVTTPPPFTKTSSHHTLTPVHCESAT